VLVRRFERGTGLAIDLPAEPGYPGETLVARVVHLRVLPEGGWLLGCAFHDIIPKKTVTRLARSRPAATVRVQTVELSPATLAQANETVEADLSGLLSPAEEEGSKIEDRPSPTRSTTVDSQSSVSPGAEARPHDSVIRLRGLAGPVAGQIWEGGPRLRVGRIEGFEICLDDSSVSRKHADIIWTPEGWTVHDLGSRNGTFLNSHRMGPSVEKVRTGDVVQFGMVPLVVEELRHQEAAPPAPPRPALQIVHAVRLSARAAADLVLREAPARDRGNPLSALCHIGRSCQNAQSLEAYLGKVVWEAAEFFEALQGAFVYQDAKTGLLSTLATCEFGPRIDPAVWAQASWVRQTLDQGQSLLFQADSPPVPVPGELAPRSLLCTLVRMENRNLGVLCLVRTADQEPFAPGDLHLAEALGHGLAISTTSFETLLGKQHLLFLQTLGMLADLVGARSHDGGNHGQRVTHLALLLADELKLSAEEKNYLRIGTPLHDLGKMGVGDQILHKFGPLNPAEERELRVQVEWITTFIDWPPPFAPLVPIFRNIFERWDGTGYPDNLAGAQIPVLARVVAVAEAFDALTSDRPNRPAQPLPEAFADLHARAGTQFDPAVVAALFQLRAVIEQRHQEERNVCETYSLQELFRTPTG
jgi:HD-GYP domain-containing protein (c-di-GMP phosphodiesterase class II)